MELLSSETQSMDNDYAVGRLVEAVSSSAYWKDPAVFIVEDDARRFRWIFSGKRRI
jgi:hypothetical protein